MDEGNARYGAGHQGDGTVHRVGLTRHCLASGLVQLPFALRDTFPEGELLALDVERDEAVVLESVPPRKLAGLAEFFEAHELQVNDQLEIRIRGHDASHDVGHDAREVRLVAVRSARRPARREDRRPGGAEHASSSHASSSHASASARTRDPAIASFGSRDARGPVDDASSASEDGTSSLPDTAVQDALEHGGWSSVQASWSGPDVVETIGSVTVRRLGAGRFSSPSATTLAQPAPGVDGEAPSSRDARLGAEARDASDPERADTSDRPIDHAVDDPVDHAVDHAVDHRVEAPVEPDVEDASEAHDAAAEKRPGRASAEADDPGLPAAGLASTQANAGAEAEADILLAVDDAPAPPPEAERTSSTDAAVRQPALFAPRDAGRPPLRAAPLERSAPRRSAKPFVTPDRPRPVVLNEEDLADPDRADPDRADSDRADPHVADSRLGAPHLPQRDLAAPDAAEVARQRAREEELSRAGDLRSRIVRWLLAPSTPVIVPIERVQHAFDLPVDVAREVVEGVLEAPPPSLRLTRLREDLLRVSRVTVEQDA